MNRPRCLDTHPLRTVLVGATLSLTPAVPAAAQRPVTLEEALSAALHEAPRVAAAQADSSAEWAAIRTAAQYPNPALALGYSESAPNYHLELEQELEYPWVRGPRIQAARAAASAASLRVRIERARIRYDVVAAYAGAAAARQIASLSARQATDGAELVRIARERRAVGDASDLDVDLSEVNAAQLRSMSLSDSLQSISSILELQSAMGFPVDSVRILPVDTLPSAFRAPPDSALAVAAGEAERLAAFHHLAEQRRSRLPAPALRAGFEEGDPSGDEPGVLPTVGVAIPLPLFNNHGGAIATARAEAARSTADLVQARREAALAMALADRAWSLAQARLEADRAALASAERVASLSLAGYREGAYPLASVLEAQRSAREAERRVLDDVSAVRTAQAALALARLGGVRP